ncbi:energy transducer TonB [Pedobacter heparinus]|uniref:energy transducer TonB n=1 Tax=Pedobacter heparinus TaxID=984 RepID=UPI00292D5FEE|nr:energy transducer TonB [Pedobacter heparinus]
MNKIRFLFTVFLFTALTATAQRQNRYFLKNNGQYVKLRDSADYLRIVQEPDPGSELYKVNEYYLDGSDKSAGLSGKIDPPLYEGKYISYHKNGKKKMEASYKKGKLIDTAYHYYPNGNLYTVAIYRPAPDGKTSRYIETVKDSIGKELVVKGNGACVFYDSNFQEISESGVIRNGFYDGIWIGGTSRSALKYKETYLNGNMVSGESTDKEGVAYQYTKAEIQPQFKGGMKNFYSYLSKTIKYPEACLRSRIQGKVLLKFLVMKDGTVKDIKVLNNPHLLLAAEAVRVVSASPLWEPGVQRGKPANVFYNVPVSFTLRP